MKPFLFISWLCWALSAWGQSPAPCLDSDGDGFCDAVDREPYSPKNCEVDSLGVALDDDKDGIPNCYDKEPDSPPLNWDMGCPRIVWTDTLFDRQVMAIICDADPNRSDLPFSSEWYPELYYLAQLTRSDTSLRLTACVAGASSEQAVDIKAKVVAYLSHTYQFAPARWVWRSPCEEEAAVPTLRVEW